MATEFFIRRGIYPDAETLGAAHAPTLYAARDIVGNLLGLYENGLTDEVYIVFTHFDSSAASHPYCMRLLPLTLDGFEDVESSFTPASDMLYAPSPRAVFDCLVPQCAVGLVFAALVQSSASEHSARTVSYTHLDAYKRQSLACAVVGFVCAVCFNKPPKDKTEPAGE